MFEAGSGVAKSKTVTRPKTTKRVSEYFGLPPQACLDFVDIDTKCDIPLFISPKALREHRSQWAHECVALLQDFFDTVLQLVRHGKRKEAQGLLEALGEPNETHLGLSKGVSRGSGLGSRGANEMWKSLVKSKAAETGLLSCLEDTVLLIDGIGADRVSDMITNVIRGPLIEYTQEQADQHGIPLRDDVASGPMWNVERNSWHNKYVRLPVIEEQKLLLVPKIIVRRTFDYQTQEFYQHFVLDYLQEEEIKSQTELVYTLKDGTPRVTKKALRAKYGSSKKLAARIAREAPSLLANYRGYVREKSVPHLSHRDFSDGDAGSPPDWKSMADELQSCPAGRDDATQYHHLIQRILTSMFYPDLTRPVREAEIHEGRKRIDIRFDNSAQRGVFFDWVASHYPAQYIFVECKNYSNDPKNPELDQLAGRFSPSRGQVGLLVCRTIEDRERFTKRCQDTASDDRGYIIALDDADILDLMSARTRSLGDEWQEDFLRGRFDELVM